MKKRQIAFKLYCQFIEKIYRIDNSINDIDSAMNVVVDFLIHVHRDIGLQSVGPNFIFDYLVYQFDYWIDKQVSFGDKTSINRIYSYESWKRYLNRHDNKSVFGSLCRLSKYHINSSMLRQFVTEQTIDYRGISDAEEREKNRFYQKPKGLVHCTQTTTLYNHKSFLCGACISSELCKKMLREDYFAIYVDRGYESK